MTSSARKVEMTKTRFNYTFFCGKCGFAAHSESKEEIREIRKRHQDPYESVDPRAKLLRQVPLMAHSPCPMAVVQLDREYIVRREIKALGANIYAR